MLFARDELRLHSRPGAWSLALCAISLALVLIAILARDAVAQERPVEPFDLVGTVLDDATGLPLLGAFVSFEGSEWGSVTDERGRFRVPDVFPGPVILSVQQLGYEALSWEGGVNADGEAVELRLTPKPIVLEGLQVVTDRFSARRNATATTVRAYDRRELARTAQETALDFVTLRSGSARTSCGSGSVAENCLFVRGRSIVPTVYVDEHRVIGGLDYLDAIRPHELYLVEIFGLGRHVRVYTNRFMERAARIRPLPIALLF